MKDETGGVGIKIFFRLKVKMYSFLVDDNSEYKKSRAVNVVATISHNKYEDVLLNNECLRHSINRIKSKDHRIIAYKTNKNSLSCFDDKIYIQSNRNHELALGYLS